MSSISTESVPGAAKTVEPSLHRVMGPWLLLLFIVGDILGTGIYALTGQVAKQVGGVVWMPFVVAFAVAPHSIPTVRSASISSPSSSLSP
jgi:APA family basic amino acid/polyamine antiporter